MINYFASSLLLGAFIGGLVVFLLTVYVRARAKEKRLQKLVSNMDQWREEKQYNKK
jgi:uncharacterized membrane-anchored protein YhcB (DUF1043 family)